MDIKTIEEKLVSVKAGRPFSLTVQQLLSSRECFDALMPKEGNTFWRITKVTSVRADNMPIVEMLQAADRTMLRARFDKNNSVNEIWYELRDSSGECIYRWGEADIPEIHHQCMQEKGESLFRREFLNEISTERNSLCMDIEIQNILDIHETEERKEIGLGLLRFILDSGLPMPGRYVLPAEKGETVITVLTEEEQRYISCGKNIGLTISPALAKRLSKDRVETLKQVKRMKLD